jgi:hypothetical protein
MLVMVALPAAALPPQSDHAAIQAVPAPGTVTIDGALDAPEWDRSGAMFVYPVRDLRERYAVRVHAMWDANALYLGLVYRDPTPMINNVNADASPDIGWQSDGFQARFWVGNQQYHLTAWYSSFSGKAVGHLVAGAPAGGQARVFPGSGLRVDDPSGFTMAFRKDTDSRGYTQEIRLPWSLFDASFRPQAGASIGFSGEYFWGDASGIRWPQVMWSDPINPANRVRIVIFQNPAVWGKLDLLGSGNLPRIENEDPDDERVQGPIPLRVDLPKTATRFTLVVDDTNGRRVRNLVSHGSVDDYRVGVAGATQQTVEVRWDGRADGPWDPAQLRFIGEVVAAGKYVVRGLSHAGVGLVHAGSFYNPGNPPWPTADGSGGWISDHNPATSVAAAPRGAAYAMRVFIGSPIHECGASLIGIDADGRKRWQWTRGQGEHLAANATHLFTAWYRNVTRLNPDTGREAAFADGRFDIPMPADITGLAARDQMVAAALGAQNRILILDANSGATVKELSIPSPSRLAFADADRLVVVTGEGLRVVQVSTGTVTPLSLPAVKQAVAVAVVPDGRLLVVDGSDQDVKVFKDLQDGAAPLARLGQPGGHLPGAWDPQRMGAPCAVAVQASAAGESVWVVEPGPVRRVSVWNPDGRLAHDYLGNAGYQGWDGMLSDDVAGVGYCHNTLFNVDLTNHSYQVKSVMGGRPEPAEGKVALFSLDSNAAFSVPFHFVSAASGQPREYVTEGGMLLSLVFMAHPAAAGGERWLPVAALGHASTCATLGWPASLPAAPSPNAVFTWSDLNGDGYQSADEITWHDPGRPGVLGQGYQWGYRSDRNLAWYFSGLAFKPVRFLDSGAPVYDSSKAEALPGELGQQWGGIYRTGFGYVALHGVAGLETHLAVAHGQQEIAGYDEAGHKRWSYPNFWIATHGAASAPIAMPGVIMGLLKFAGFPRMDGWDFMSIQGNMGQQFLLRSDGVYLGELFTDQRMAPNSLPASRECIGIPINDTSMGGEPFAGWMSRQNDGKVRLTYGHTDVRVAEVTGLDSVRDIPPALLKLSAEQVAACAAFQPRKPGESGKKSYRVARGGAFLDDAAFGGDAMIVRRGREEVGRAVMRYDATNLYVAWQVSDTTPLRNAGSPGPLLFKTGDSVNVYVAPAGDYAPGQLAGARVLLAQVEGQPTAVVYRPHGPGEAPFVFESPVRKTPFQFATVVGDVAIRANATGSGSTVFASIPWRELGLAPTAGLALRGDVGILFSDQTGTQTAQRNQWADKEVNVVNDVPTEAEFFPARWGEWVLE